MVPQMLSLFARFWLRVRGWKVEGEPPTETCVYLAVPHTSNWDGWMLLLFAWALRLNIRWMAKHTLLKPPLGFILKSFGAVAVDRRAANGLVGQMVDALGAGENIMLCVPPEGTRSRRDFWKSGFYHIAHGAQVPICLGVLDYGRRRGGFGPLMELTGDMSADMDRVRAFYGERGPTGRNPEQQSPILLKGEGDNVEDAAAVPSPASDALG